jgi:hypothetical protein
MVASAYGICLSQDRIAYFLNPHAERIGVQPNIYDVNDMSHDEDAAYGCYEAFADNDCEQALAWALALRNGEVPGVDPPEDAELFIPYPTTSGASAAATAAEMWLAEGRPIMAEIGGHAVVSAGFCRDGTGLGHLLIYDPKSGPYVTPFAYWHSNRVKKAWIAPSSLGESGGRIVAGRGHSDDFEMWLDSDSDSLCDFDEIRRFSLDPTQLVTSPGYVDPVRVYLGDFDSEWTSFDWPP